MNRDQFVLLNNDVSSEFHIIWKHDTFRQLDVETNAVCTRIGPVALCS